jgi:TolB-like protein/DNA-binding SARP family transcriptional activator
MIRLRTLGVLDLRSSDGQELRAVLAQPKRVALLAYLALSTPRRCHRRDSLLPLFWPDLDDDHARDALSQAVRFLRRSLGDGVLLSRHGDELELDWQDLWCDAVAFEEALDAGRRVDALDLYRGQLLDGFHVANAPDFERWLSGERDRLARRHLGTMEGLAHECEAADDFGGAAVWWRRLAAADPYNSRVALQLMRSLASAGDPGGAVHHARVHGALLREELNVAPDPQVTMLVKELESGTGLAKAPRPPSPVPLPSTHSEASAEVPHASTDRESAPVLAGDSFVRRPLRRKHALLVAGGLVAVTAAAIAIAIGQRDPAVPPIRSLAVIPLENLSRDSAQQPFVDGMHDALITELARYPGLSVISRTSVMRYRGTTKSVPEIARELRVDGVVEGSILRQGERVSVRVQLVHGPSDRHLWARRYERSLRDMLLLQGDLAEAIASEVRVATTPLQRRGRTVAGRVDSTAREVYLREHYLRGRHSEIGRTLTGLQAATEAYRRAIARDSTFALGYAGLSTVYYLMADYDYSPVGPALDSARIMARRAMALDSTLSETRTALAVTLASDREFDAAEREFTKAIELSPSDARAHFWYSVLLVALGRGEDALREANRAAELDPFAPRGVSAMRQYARYLLTGQRAYLKQPVNQRRPILKVEPGEPWARAREGVEYAEEGKCAEARTEITHAQRLAPDDNRRMLQNVAAVHWLCGERARARAIVQQMKRRSDSHEHGYHIALPLARFGERDSALAWLGRQRWTVGHLSGLRADSYIDPLRSDPRYAQLLTGLGLRPVVRTDSGAQPAPVAARNRQ